MVEGCTGNDMIVLGRDDEVIMFPESEHDGDITLRNDRIKRHNLRKVYWAVWDGQRTRFYDPKVGAYIRLTNDDLNGAVTVFPDGKNLERSGFRVASAVVTTYEKFFSVPKTKIWESVFASGSPVENWMRLVDDTTKILSYLDPNYGSYTRAARSWQTKRLVKRLGRSKSNLDIAFEAAHRYSFSEAFMHTSGKRSGAFRNIVVYDVNSMYPFALTLEIFPDYKRLRKVRNPRISDVLEMGNGIWLVTMKLGPELGKYSALYPRRSCRTFQLDMTGRKVTVWLPWPELAAYAEYADDIVVHMGVASEGAVSAVSEKSIRFLYGKRKDSSPALASAIKNLLVAMPSLFVKSGTRRKVVINEMNAARIAVATGFLPDASCRRFRTLSSNTYGIVKSIETIDEERSVSSIPATVYSYGRARMFRAVMELIRSGGKPAYVNVDSVHAVFDDPSQRDAFESVVGVSDSLGAFKIDAEGDAGHWFAPGFYYIADGDEIVRYGSPIDREKRKGNPFKQAERRDGMFGEDHFVRACDYAAYGKIANEDGTYSRLPYDDNIEGQLSYLKRLSSESCERTLKELRKMYGGGR